MNISTQQGFTLIELVIVLAIIGIAGALAAPRWSPSDTTVAAQAHRLARDLRHVQGMAMHRGQTVLLDIQSAGAYRVTDSGGVTAIDPATSQAFQVAMENDVTVTGPDMGFDSLGRPVSGGNLLSVARVYTLSGDANTATVTVRPVTGFISVSP